MKKILVVASAVLAMTLTSCETVPSGHKGVKVNWGGKTDMETIYNEGMATGLNWLWDDMVVYSIQEQTLKEKYHFNDANNMNTGVELALDYALEASKVNSMHVNIGAGNLDIKIQKILQSASKEVIPQYSATELNLSKRAEAEQKISSILEKELPQIYVRFARLQLTDVDIPKEISNASIATAEQKELSKLAEERRITAENNFKTAEWDAKTKDVLSKPAMLELQRLENEKAWINKWDGSFGDNNVFGADGMTILKGKK